MSAMSRRDIESACYGAAVERYYRHHPQAIRPHHMKPSSAIRRDAPTERQIRDYLGHGSGTRKVRVQQDGVIRMYGSCLPGPTGFSFWQRWGHTNDLIVDARGQVKERPQRSVKGSRRGKR